MSSLIYAIIGCNSTTNGNETLSTILLEYQTFGLVSIQKNAYNQLPPKSLIHNACAYNRKTDYLHVIGTNGDSSIYHHTMNIGEDGPNDWDKVPSNVIQLGKAGPPPGISEHAVCCIDQNKIFHVFAIREKIGLQHIAAPARSAINEIYEVIEWPENEFWDIIAPPDGIFLDPKIAIQDIACATDTSGNLHFFMIDTSGLIWHTLINPATPDEPTLLQTSWEAVTKVTTTSSIVGRFYQISCTPTDSGGLVLCAIGDNDRLYYNYYDNDNGFQIWRDVWASAAVDPNSHQKEKLYFATVSCCSGSDNHLHIITTADNDQSRSVYYIKLMGWLSAVPEYGYFIDIQNVAGVFPGTPGSVSLVQN